MAHSVDMSPLVGNATAGAAAPGASAPVDGQRGGPGASGVASSSRHDRVELSEQARLLEKMAQVLQSTPEEREAVVAAVRARLDAGTYTVDAMRLATRLAPTLTPPVAPTVALDESGR